MSAERHILDKNNTAFTSRLFSLPYSMQWLKAKPSHLNNFEIHACTSDVFLLHQQMNFFPHNSLAVSNYGVYEEKKQGKWNLSVPLCCHRAHGGLDSWKLGQQKWRHPHSESQNELNELPVSVCHRYRVSPAQLHTGSESHLFTSRLQAADCSSPTVTGRGGGQISFWNFNLLQLNYLISEPPTSKEYLNSLLTGCLDGGFQSRLLKD